MGWGLAKGNRFARERTPVGKESLICSLLRVSLRTYIPRFDGVGETVKYNYYLSGLPNANYSAPETWLNCRLMFVPIHCTRRIRQ